MALDHYLQLFSHLRVDSGPVYPAIARNRAPHKPLLLLSIMDHIAEGLIVENFISPDQELVDTFNSYIALVLSPEWQTSLAHPFPRLKTDGFWHRVTNPGFDPKAEYNIKSISKLREIYAGAKLDEPLFLYMVDSVTRLALRTVLISTYFAEEIRPALIEQSRVNFESYQYSRQLLSELREGIEEWSQPEKARVRDQGFRKTIVQLYEHRCAICGIRIMTPEGHTVVEAAHIKPWSECQDDLPNNGIALCRLCHWSFDEGFVSIGGNYEVLVSGLVQNEPNRSGHIGTFERRPIIKPADEIYWPGQENTAWHRKNKFRNVSTA